MKISKSLLLIVKSLLLIVLLGTVAVFAFILVKKHDYYSSQEGVVIVDSKEELDSRADYVEALGAFRSGDLQKAGELDWKAIQIKDVSNELRSSELLLMGTITMAMNRLDISVGAFDKVMNMPNAPQQDKKIARQDIAIVMMLLQQQVDQAQEEEGEHHGHHSESPQSDIPSPIPQF